MDTIKLQYVPGEVIDRLIGPYDGTDESIIQRTQREARYVRFFTGKANSFRVKVSDYDSFKSASIYDLKNWVLNFISSTQWTIDREDVLLIRSQRNIEAIRDDLLNLQAAIKFDRTSKAHDKHTLTLKIADIREHLDQIETRLNAGDYQLYQEEPIPGWGNETFPEASIIRESIPNYFASLLPTEDLKVATDLIGKITDPPHAAAFVTALAKDGRLEPFDTMLKGKKSQFAEGLKDFFKLNAGEPAIRKQLREYHQIGEKHRPNSREQLKINQVDYYLEMLKSGSKSSGTD